MTGGLERDEVSPLDGMTDEEKEQEAIKLNDLIHRLNRYVINNETYDHTTWSLTCAKYSYTVRVVIFKVINFRRFLVLVLILKFSCVIKYNKA